MKVAMTGLAMYGIAWGISSFQSSPTYAVAGGIVAPILIFMGLFYGGYVFDTPWLQKHFETIYASLCAPLGVAGFAIGTWHYLHHVET